MTSVRSPFETRGPFRIVGAVGALAVLAACGGDPGPASGGEDTDDQREVLADGSPADYDRTLHRLALTPEDVEGVDLTPLPDEDISQMAERDPMLTEAMRTEPEGCMDVAGSPIGPGTGPGDFHAQVGVVEEHQFGVFLFSDTEFVDGLPALSDECRDFTIHLDTGGPGDDGMVSQLSSEEFDAPEPDGVESFVSVLQNAAGTTEAEEIETQSAILSGAVDGRGVQVTVQSFSGDIPDSILDTASDVFDAQAARLAEE